MSHSPTTNVLPLRNPSLGIQTSPLTFSGYCLSDWLSSDLNEDIQHLPFLIQFTSNIFLVSKSIGLLCSPKQSLFPFADFVSPCATSADHLFIYLIPVLTLSYSSILLSTQRPKWFCDFVHIKHVSTVPSPETNLPHTKAIYLSHNFPRLSFFSYLHLFPNFLIMCFTWRVGCDWTLNHKGWKQRKNRTDTTHRELLLSSKITKVLQSISWKNFLLSAQ